MTLIEQSLQALIERQERLRDAAQRRVDTQAYKRALEGLTRLRTWQMKAENDRRRIAA